MFFFALLKVFLAPYIWLFDIIIVNLIAGVVLAQKVSYLNEVNFHDIDCPPYILSQQKRSYDYPSLTNHFVLC